MPVCRIKRKQLRFDLYTCRVQDSCQAVGFKAQAPIDLFPEHLNRLATVPAAIYMIALCGNTERIRLLKDKDPKSVL
jgi:hypothetical protein